ncbi:MAG TPA: right-handed parallel beta-helix repeat-containing protein, partial [Bacteroidia bacterium]
GDLLPVPGSDNFLISYLENDLNTSTVQTKISSMNGINGAVNWTVVSNQTMSITRYSDMQIINNQIYCNTIASNNYYVFNPLFNANATSIGNGNLCYTRSNMPLLNLNFYQANQTNLTNIFNNQDVTINETDATSTATVSKTLCTNCLALNTQSTIVIPDETVINSSVLWGAVGTAQKYYIEGELTVNNAILDITNIDVIFGPCARINFVNNGRIRANNSVFRSCDENAFWDGLYFDMSADNKIESCVFKNASRALSFNFNSTANISNNEFLNCYRGIEIAGHLNFNNPISNNQFIIDRLLPTTAECVNNVPVTACFGIVLNNSIVNGEISQNNFIQNLDATRNVNLSGLNATNSAFTASENTFTNNFRAFDIIGERDIANNPWKIINNSIEFTRLYKTNLSAIQAHQIYIKGGIENSGNEISKNTIRKTSTEVLPNTMGIMLDPDAGGPKSALRIMNVVIKENYIEGFSYGTYCLRTRNIMVTKNTYKNNSSIGVLFHESSNLFITCNTIDMLNDNSNVKFGIQVGDMEVIQGSTAFGKIHSNCIFNTERGMFIYAPYPNSPCPQAPEIRNNYIYNFINSGIYIRNMSTAIGDNVFPGMNSFISNTYPTTQAWDIEVVSQNVLIPSIVSQKENYSNKAFNFTPNVTGDPYGLDKIKYSIASCANQNQHQQGGFAFHGKYSDALDCQSKAAFSPWGNPGGDGGGGGQIPVFVSGNRLRIYQYIHTHVWNKNDHETLTNWMDMIKTNPNLKAEDHAEMEYLMSIKIQDEDNQLKLIKANMNTSNFFYLEALKNNLVDADRNKLISISMDSLYTQTCYFLLSKMGSPLVFNSIIPEMESTELNSSLNSRIQMLPMSIYPNPISEGDIKVDINMDGFTGFKNIKILDFMGMEVFSAEVYLMNGTVQINVNDFNLGVYNLILTDESGKTFVGKFVKL